MGNIDSVPVVSQVKSLVQVIGGDARGAKRTQEKFARTAPIVSQVNSLGHAIAGDAKGAKAIQVEFGNDAYALSKSLPIVGHGIALGHAIAGDHKEAEKIALGATKSTLQAGAGLAGLACGPYAPACSGGLVVASGTIWDAGESGIQGKKTGRIAGWDNLIHGRSTVGEGFDIVGGTILEAGAGALGAKIGSKLWAKFKGTKIGSKFRGGRRGGKSNLARCKRATINEESHIYDNGLPDVPVSMVHRLPGSVTNIQLTYGMSPLSVIDTTLSVIFILKLMSIAHVESKVYYDEICHGIYPSMQIEECSSILHTALYKFEHGEDVLAADFQITDNKESGFLFADLLDGLEFGVKSLGKNTITGHYVEVLACNTIVDNKDCVDFVERFKEGLQEINTFIGKHKQRSKRMINCKGGPVAGTGKKAQAAAHVHKQFAEAANKNGWTLAGKGKEVYYTKGNERISVPGNHNKFKKGSLSAALDKFEGNTNNGQKLKGGASASSHQ